MLSNTQKIKMHNTDNINKWEWYADGEYLRARVINPNSIQKIASHYRVISVLMFVLSLLVSLYITYNFMHAWAATKILMSIISSIIITVTSLVCIKNLSGHRIASFPVTWDYTADTDSLDNIRRLPQVAATLNNYKFLNALKPEENYQIEYYHLLDLVENSNNSHKACNKFRDHYNNNLDLFKYAPKNYEKYKKEFLDNILLKREKSQSNINGINDDSNSTIDVKRELSGSELDVLTKIVDAFPEAINFSKMLPRLEELSATDYRNFTVIVHEITTHYYNIMQERENNNDELADAMVREFNPLLNKTILVVNRMMDTINQIKLDDISISNIFISDKFHITD